MALRCLRYLCSDDGDFYPPVMFMSVIYVIFLLSVPEHIIAPARRYELIAMLLKPGLHLRNWCSTMILSN